MMCGGGSSSSCCYCERYITNKENSSLDKKKNDGVICTDKLGALVSEKK